MLFYVAGKGHDLISINIQRGRDHGLPGYNHYRAFFGLRPIASMDEKPDEIDESTWDAIRLVYSHPDDIDLYAGGLGETAMFGNKPFQLYHSIFSRQMTARYRLTTWSRVVTYAHLTEKILSIFRRTARTSIYTHRCRSVQASQGWGSIFLHAWERSPGNGVAPSHSGNGDEENPR